MKTNQNDSLNGSPVSLDKDKQDLGGTRPASASGPHRLLMLALLAGLLVMLGTAVWQRFTEPELVQQVAHVSAQHSQEEMSAVGRLMEQVSQNPTDMDGLLSLVNALVKMENWEAAENFARRAIELDGKDPRPLHLLGVIQHNTGRHADAARTLEGVIALRDDPSVRYSLGVLYIYYLNDKERGLAQLRAGLALPGISDSLKKHIQSELDKDEQKTSAGDAANGQQ